MRPKTLAYAIIFIVAFVFIGKRVTTWRVSKQPAPQLVRIDTSEIQSILLQAGEKEREISLQRESGKWIVSDGTHSTISKNEFIDSLLINLNRIAPFVVIASHKEQWENYNLAPRQAIHVQIFYNNEIQEDLFLNGRFEEKAKDTASFLRIGQQVEVYSMKKIDSSPFLRTFNQYRSKSIIKLHNEAAISKIIFESLDTTYSIQQDSNAQWILNDQIIVDSLQMLSFLSGLKELNGDDFSDDFDEIDAESLLQQKLTLSGKQGLPPIVIHSYRDSLNRFPIIIHSSENPDAYFESDTTGVYHQVFGNLEDLLTKQSEKTIAI